MIHRHLCIDSSGTSGLCQRRLHNTGLDDAILSDIDGGIDRRGTEGRCLRGMFRSDAVLLDVDGGIGQRRNGGWRELREL